jgi:paraquat-inducible protein A
MNDPPLTAKNSGMVSCHACSLLVRAGSLHHGHGNCPRCGGALHLRRPNSISRCWALLIAGIICYIPANILPVMTVIQFGEGEGDTIMSGVKAFIADGQYPLALLVFFASIFVPVLKIILLTYLLISVQIKSLWRPRERTVMYRITEAVGRWSMVDIFMISILAALVKLGSIATIEPSAGAVFFAAVVILTMFAAMAFDPRLLWDVMENKDD